MSPLPASLFAAEGVIKLKLPFPAGLGKISPSISQNAFRSLYQVSSGIFARIGLRGYISRSINFHIASDSAICVSASITPAMILSPIVREDSFKTFKSFKPFKSQAPCSGFVLQHLRDDYPMHWLFFELLDESAFL